MGNSAASTWTQLRGATPPGASGEGFPAKALLGAGRAEGLEGLPGEKTRHLQGVEEAWGTRFGWSLGQKDGRCRGQLRGFRGAWAVNRARLCVLGNSLGQGRVGGWEEQVAGLVLAELWGRGESDSASRLGGCAESGDGHGGRSWSLPQPRL